MTQRLKLYPLKFKPIPVEKVWGGRKLTQKYNLEYPTNGNYGETLTLSELNDNVSIVSNGFLEGNGLDDLLEDGYLRFD